MRLFNVGLSAWIVQDGNYGDFSTGQTYSFALEFYPHQIKPTSLAPSLPLLEHTVGALYRATGTVVHVTPTAWVVDWGIPAFQESQPPSWARSGISVSGSIYLGIDPFFYLERLKDEVGMPDLFRQWLVHRIHLETTPWVDSTDASGRTFIQRADSAPTFTECTHTDAWADDSGHAHYVLECELQPPMSP
jgi:hypothetical protein